MTQADWVSKDFYADLGVAKDASQAEIKKAYRKLARANHPDSHPGDEAKHDKFKNIAQAYDVIGDADKRKEYDEVRSMPAGFGFGGGGGGAQQDFDLSDLFGQQGGGGFQDVFGDMFGGGGGRQRPPRPRRGADVETTATLGFVEALDGATVSLRLASDEPCTTCSGTGGKPGTRPRVCTTCEGAGFIVNSQGGGFSLRETCPTCGGRQLSYDAPCPVCHGSGKGASSRTIQARIPAGVKDGQKIRLKGKGSAGQNGGPAGDLFVNVSVTPHRLFGRKADNLTLEVPVSIDELALGAEIKVPTLGGAPVTLKIPAGTPNGRTFRVRGKGPRRRDGKNGDLLATLEVKVPGTLSAQAREALQQYREATAESTLRSKLFE